MRTYASAGALFLIVTLTACGGNAPTSAPPMAERVQSLSSARSATIAPALEADRLLYFFLGGAGDGAGPRSALTAIGDGFYGTTVSGGNGGTGTLFYLTPPSAGQSVWNERDYSLTGGTGTYIGTYPAGRFIQVGASLYGMMESGGANGNGTVIELSPQTGTPPEAYTVTVLYAFTGGTDGGTPVGGLTAIGNTLYGVTSSGGSDGVGTIFSLAPPSKAGGKWKEMSLLQLDPSVGWRSSGDLLAENGILYGTFGLGNPNGDTCCGEIFALSTTGGSSAFHVLYSFAGSPDGEFPWGRLLQDGTTLYGTAQNGGTACQSAYPKGCGVAFELTPPAAGRTTWSERVLYSFGVAETDGVGPNGDLTQIGASLFGTAGSGGEEPCECGVVYRLTPSPHGWNESILHAFAGEDGDDPVSGLVYANGRLYGTTQVGGAGEGVVYSVTP